jgi:capsule polysaccharide export protein KpsE/RkpR
VSEEATKETYEAAHKRAEELVTDADELEERWQSLRDEKRLLDREFMQATAVGDAREMVKLTTRRQELEVEVPAAEVQYRRARIASYEAQRRAITLYGKEAKPQIESLERQIKELQQQITVKRRELSRVGGRGNQSGLNSKIAAERARLDSIVARTAQTAAAPVVRNRARIGA